MNTQTCLGYSLGFRSQSMKTAGHLRIPQSRPSWLLADRAIGQQLFYLTLEDLDKRNGKHCPGSNRSSHRPLYLEDCDSRAQMKDSGINLSQLDHRRGGENTPAWPCLAQNGPGKGHGDESHNDCKLQCLGNIFFKTSLSLHKSSAW